MDTSLAVDAILRWIALRPRRWSSRIVLHLTPLRSPQFQSALQAFLGLLDPASHDQIARALERGNDVLLPLEHHRLLSTLSINALSDAAKNLERLMEQASSCLPGAGDTAAASRKQVDSLLLLTVLAIERNWIYPVDVTDFDPAQLGYPKEYFFRILDLIVRLERFEWRPSLPEAPRPATLADLSKRLPILRLNLIAMYALGRFVHDAAVLGFIEDSAKAQTYLNDFVIHFAHYNAIHQALGERDLWERRIFSTIAAESLEMLASLQMRDRSEVFPLDYIATSQLLKDRRLASKVAKAGVFDDLITKPTGYMLKVAPLIRFKRDPAASEDAVELAHPIHFLIDAIRKDIPPGVSYVDFTIAAGGVHMIAVSATAKFGLSTTRHSLHGRTRDLISGQTHQLLRRRPKTDIVDPQVVAPKDGSNPAEAVWIENTLTHGFQLDQVGQWRPFESDVRTYVSPNEWESALRALFDVLLDKLLPKLDEHNITHLVINPDRSLNLLPFALLKDGDGNCLFDRKKISLVPTLPHFINALLRSNLDHYRSWNRVLILVDTHSGPDDFALERRLVGSVFGDREVLIHTTEDFDEPSFIRDAERADVVHVCTHAAFDARKPRESGINIGNDRWFDLTKIEKLRLQRHSIVFLSACETGALDVSDRFNRASISQSFLDAGAGSVIATQWKVDGRPMALLSYRFYQLLLNSGCRNTLEALRTAQLWLKNCSTSEVSNILGKRLVTTEKVPYEKDFNWGGITLWGSWI